MKKHSIGSLLFIGLVLVIMYLPIAVVVVYSFNANTARIPIEFTGWNWTSSRPQNRRWDWILPPIMTTSCGACVKAATALSLRRAASAMAWG